MRLWLENKLDKEWKMEDIDIVTKFLESKYSGGQYYIDVAISHFITAKDGLNSVFGNEDFNKLIDLLLKILDKKTLEEYQNAKFKQRGGNNAIPFKSI